MRAQIQNIDPARQLVSALTQARERIEFTIAVWRSPSPPRVDQWIEYRMEEGVVKSAYEAPQEQKRSPSAAVVLGAIASACVAFAFIVPILPAIAGMILGIIAAQRAQQDGDRDALLLARIGWIGGVIWVCLSVLMIFVGLAFLALAANFFPWFANW